MKKKIKKTNSRTVSYRRFQCAILAGVLSVNFAVPVFAQDEVIAPNKADYGYYVDEYWKNGDVNYRDTDQNPANGVLSQLLNYYTPVHAWDSDTGWKEGVFTEDGAELQKMNISESAKISANATEAEKELAYFDDRRDKNYSMISGLGIYAEEFKTKSGAKTTITEIATDSNINKYVDLYDDNLWNEDLSSEQYTEIKDYKGIVDLVKTFRNTAASTSRVKRYYNFARPFRWSDISSEYSKVTVLSTLEPCKKSDEESNSDGGYPSGHTNAANLAALAMAYSVPEQYSEMVLRAGELGNSRIVAGMHSCLDVIGGRIMSTAIAAAALNNPDNAVLKEKAIEAGNKLVKTVGEKSDYTSYQQDKEKNLYRLTYNLKLDNSDTTKPMTVPKGAEALLESRFPYLDTNQLRYILYTTGLPSGYSVLDDKEGWGRLNLFEASNGYGSFVTDVSVNMDSSKGGFNAADNWRNDIDGTGSLTKKGTGMLVLSGNNTYTGGTTVEEGSIRADYSSAFGDGNVVNKSTIKENITDTLFINGDYTQDKDGVLELTISDEKDYVSVSGNADLSGKLVINIDENMCLNTDILLLQCKELTGTFSEIQVNAPDSYKGEIVYTEQGISLKNNEESESIAADIESDNVDSSPHTGEKNNWVVYAIIMAMAGVIFYADRKRIAANKK